MALTKVTNSLLDGSIANDKLANSSITINSSATALGASITLDSDDIGEGSTNLYYTPSRVNSVVLAGTGVTKTFASNEATFSISTGAITNAMLEGSIANSKLTNSSITINGSATALGASITLDTDGITEGSSNLYFTNERVDDRVNSLVGVGFGLTKTYNDISNTLTFAKDLQDILLSNLQGLSTTGLSANDVVEVHGRTAVGDGYEGKFKWVTGDQSSNVTADSEKAIWVAPTGDTSGASGAWQRVYNGHTYHPRWFGAKGDAITNDTAALIKAFAYLDHGDTMDLENLEYSVWHVGTDAGEYDLADHIPQTTGSSTLDESLILELNEVIRVAEKANITVKDGFIHAYAEGQLGTTPEDRRVPLGSGTAPPEPRYFPSILNFDLCYNLKVENLKVHARSSRYGLNPTSSLSETINQNTLIGRTPEEKRRDLQTAFGCACIVFECYQSEFNNCEFKYGGDVGALYNPGPGHVTFNNCFGNTGLYEGGGFNTDSYGGLPEEAQARAFSSTSLGSYKHLMRFTTIFEASYNSLSGTFSNAEILTFTDGGGDTDTAKAKFVGIDTSSNKIYFSILNEEDDVVNTGDTVTGSSSGATVTLTSEKSITAVGDDAFNVTYNNCSSYFTNYVAATEKRKYGSKSCILIEDHPVNAVINGGYFADAVDFNNNSADVLGGAFTVGSTNKLLISNVVVEDCKYVLAVNIPGATDHDTQVFLNDVHGERLKVGGIYIKQPSSKTNIADPLYIQADNCHFNIQDSRYQNLNQANDSSFDFLSVDSWPQYNSADYPTFVAAHRGSTTITKLGRVGLVLNNCTSSGAETLIAAPHWLSPIIQPFETTDQQATSTTNLYEEGARSVGLVINGGYHSVKNRVIDVAAWGHTTDPGSDGAGIEIINGARFNVTNTGTVEDSIISNGVADRSAVFTSYNKTLNDGGSSVFQYINIDPTVTVRVAQSRTIYNNSVSSAAFQLRRDRNATIERSYADKDGYTEYNLSNKILFSDLPTSDPTTAGQLWNDSGTLKVSAG